MQAALSTLSQSTGQRLFHGLLRNAAAHFPSSVALSASAGDLFARGIPVIALRFPMLDDHVPVALVEYAVGTAITVSVLDEHCARNA